MNKILFLILAVGLAGCGKKSSVNLPDLGPRVQLLEANDKLQDIRLDNLEVKVSDLEQRMSSAEDDIDTNEEKIAENCDDIEDLEEDLDQLRNNFRNAVRELRQADRQTRRLLRKNVRRLRVALLREIRNRQAADQDLQDQLDDLERTVDRHISRQSLINRFLVFGLYQTNLRITQLSNQINSAINNINNTLVNIQAEINDINNEINNLQSSVTNIYNEISNLEDQMVSVVENCDGSYHLDTENGLFEVGYTTRTVKRDVVLRTSIKHFICDRFVGQGNICVRGRNVTTSVRAGTWFMYEVIDSVGLVEAQEVICEGGQ